MVIVSVGGSDQPSKAYEERRLVLKSRVVVSVSWVVVIELESEIVSVSEMMMRSQSLEIV